MELAVGIVCLAAGGVLGYLLRRNNPRKSGVIEGFARKAAEVVKEQVEKVRK